MVGTVIWRAIGDHRMVEDLAQETFLRVFHALPSFDRDGSPVGPVLAPNGIETKRGINVVARSRALGHQLAKPCSRSP